MEDRLGSTEQEEDRLEMYSWVEDRLGEHRPGQHMEEKVAEKHQSLNKGRSQLGPKQRTEAQGSAICLES